MGVFKSTHFPDNKYKIPVNNFESQTGNADSKSQQLIPISQISQKKFK